jgi:hypothetical protein
MQAAAGILNTKSTCNNEQPTVGQGRRGRSLSLLAEDFGLLVGLQTPHGLTKGAT